MFGKCLLCLINWTVAVCWKYPNCKIFTKKDDNKLAYCRCHLHWARIPDLKMGFMNLRLTFGGKPCPNFWCCMSEIMCDLTTAILHDNEWDPMTLFGRNQHLVPPARSLDINIPFGEMRADCGHWCWCKRHKRYIHWWLDLVGSRNWRFRQPSLMRQSTSSHVWQVFTTFRPKQTHSTRDDGGEKWTWIGSSAGRDKSNFWLAHHFTTSFDHPAR